MIEIEAAHKVLADKEQAVKKLFENLTVAAGPFKGLRYPNFVAFGSALYPKLLGSYECELNDDLESLLENEYDTILDIGCAEGYYAVGVAMRKPMALVYAYDINQEAIEACKKMAVMNQVEENMRFGNFCSSSTLEHFDFSGRSLVFSDCEGYELELFTPQAVQNLKNCDLLIELHDLRDERISPTIEEVFKETHTIKYVRSQNTFKKLKDFNLRGDLTDEQVLDFFVERYGIMEWAIITPK